MYETGLHGGERLDFAVKCHEMMKEKMDLHLEFLKQASSLNTVTTPLMTTTLY